MGTTVRRLLKDTLAIWKNPLKCLKFCEFLISIFFDELNLDASFYFCLTIGFIRLEFSIEYVASVGMLALLVSAKDIVVFT
jgi:hypothetical protein